MSVQYRVRCFSIMALLTVVVLSSGCAVTKEQWRFNEVHYVDSTESLELSGNSTITLRNRTSIDVVDLRVIGDDVFAKGYDDNKVAFIRSDIERIRRKRRAKGGIKGAVIGFTISSPLLLYFLYSPFEALMVPIIASSFVLFGATTGVVKGDSHTYYLTVPRSEKMRQLIESAGIEVR